jgi:hypothetical protein
LLSYRAFLIQHYAGTFEQIPESVELKVTAALVTFNHQKQEGECPESANAFFSFLG